MTSLPREPLRRVAAEAEKQVAVVDKAKEELVARRVEEDKASAAAKAAQQQVIATAEQGVKKEELNVECIIHGNL